MNREEIGIRELILSYRDQGGGVALSSQEHHQAKGDRGKQNNPFVCVPYVIYKTNLYPGFFWDENQKSLRFKNASDTDGKKEGKGGQRGRTPQTVLYFLQPG
ncbi:MAG TPA: hypothetical protein PK154_08730, partial [Methanoregulaceae archaeon]|nr:hypothetical protein [Methanoregulaceae archaeon]